MADSVLKGITDEAFELVKKTGSEVKKQVQAAGTDIISTVGIKMQGPAEVDSGVNVIRRKDAVQTAAELPQVRQSLFTEMQSGTSSVSARESSIQQRAAEQQKNANRRPLQQQPADLSSVGSKPKPGSLFSSSKERVKKTQ